MEAALPFRGQRHNLVYLAEGFLDRSVGAICRR